MCDIYISACSAVCIETMAMNSQLFLFFSTPYFFSDQLSSVTNFNRYFLRMSIDLTDDTPIQHLLDTVESISCPATPQPSSTPVKYTSAGIKRFLLHDKNNYKIMSNPNKRAIAACWSKFGLPAMRMNNGEEGKFSIIKGFASCKSCFETYFYNDSSTTILNGHRCLVDQQQGLLTFTSSASPLRNTFGAKLLSKKKEDMKKLCTNWVACSMRPFSIVMDPGFKLILQECLRIGEL
jgi:hypothetical protein